METSPSSPGISVLLPPRIFLACLLGGVAVELLAPTPLSPLGPWWLAPMVGVLIAGGGFAFMGWGHGRFTAVGTAVRTCLPATELVTDGAYRHSRNPMYVGFVGILLGFGVAASSAPMALSALVMLLFLDRYVIPKEERYLLSRFGADYDAYRREVRRWL